MSDDAARTSLSFSLSLLIGTEATASQDRPRYYHNTNKKEDSRERWRKVESHNVDESPVEADCDCHGDLDLGVLGVFLDLRVHWRHLESAGRRWHRRR